MIIVLALFSEKGNVIRAFVGALLLVAKNISLKLFPKNFIGQMNEKSQNFAFLFYYFYCIGRELLYLTLT